MAAWLSNLAVIIQGYPVVLIYIITQLCIVITFIAVWKLTKNLMNPVYAMFSVICLSSIYYYLFPSIALNPNIISFPLSALLVLYVYKVTKQYSVWNWIIIGILAALAILGKYEAVFLFIPALVFFFLNKDARKRLWSWGFLAAVIVSFIILTPHIVWLFQNNFAPVYYGLDKTTPGTNVDRILDHIYWPIDYLINIILPAIPTFILFLILCFKNTGKENIERNSYNTFFIVLVALGSFVSTFFISLILGVHVNPYWTMTYYSFVGTGFLYWLRPKIDLKSRRVKFIITLCFLTVIIPASVTAVLTKVLPPVINGTTTLIQFPGKGVADYAENLWSKYSNRNLDYIGGFGPDIVAYINSYGKSRAHTYELFGQWQTPWADKKDLEKKGALLMWFNEQKSQDIRNKIKKEFHGKIINIPTHEIPWLKDSILEQCKGHPELSEVILKMSKYLPFLKEKIEPIKVDSVILLPSKE